MVYFLSLTERVIIKNDKTPVWNDPPFSMHPFCAPIIPLRDVSYNNVNTKWETFSIFLAFSEYLNFSQSKLIVVHFERKKPHHLCLWHLIIQFWNMAKFEYWILINICYNFFPTTQNSKHKLCHIPKLTDEMPKTLLSYVKLVKICSKFVEPTVNWFQVLYC